MIAVVDYGAGNLFSVANALSTLGAEFGLVRSPDEVRAASRILLPGVGHFGRMLTALDELGLRSPLTEVAAAGTPFLGICLGMQALFEGSEEAPEVEGLGLLPGVVRRFPEGCRVPHMGWNKAKFSSGEEDWFYFANSYFIPCARETLPPLPLPLVPKDRDLRCAATSEREGVIWATTEYSGQFTSAVRRDNIWGFQFHPEKSGKAGLSLLDRWCRGAG